MERFIHRLFHFHASPVAPDVGKLHFCRNRITKREKNYFKAVNTDQWIQIPRDLADRLMKAHSANHAKAILNMWRNPDGSYGDWDV